MGWSEYFKNCWSTGIFTTTISRVYREWSEKEKISSERQLCGRKCIVDVRGQRRMGRLVRDDEKATVTQITTRYNQGMQNTISAIVFRELSLQLSSTSCSQSHPSCYCSHMQPTVIHNHPQYSDLIEAFSNMKASQCSPLYSSDCAIELLPGTTPPWGRMFSFEPTWVRPSTSPAWVECRAPCPCINYPGHNKITENFPTLNLWFQQHLNSSELPSISLN